MAELWKELHKRALTFEGGNDYAYLQQFAKRIPRFQKGCACKEHWLAIVKTNPPKFGKDYFEWTTTVHNLINQRLGKPVLTVEEARKLYQ